MSELVSRTTRGLFRDLMTGSTVGAIGAAFQDELFAPNPDCTYQDSSVRRVTTQEYLEAIDWTDVNQVNRALRVFERLIQGFAPQCTSKVLNSLRRDGYTVDEETGHIASGGPRFAPSSLQNITDASAIRQQLTRIQHAVLDDPALAVGSAKELIESTAKVVLKERGQPVDDKDDLPALVPKRPTSPRPPPILQGAGPGRQRCDQEDPRLGFGHRHRAGRTPQPRLRHRPWPRHSSSRPRRLPRSPCRERRVHLVPTHARHARGPQGPLAQGTDVISTGQALKIDVASTEDHMSFNT